MKNLFIDIINNRDKMQYKEMNDFNDTLSMIRSIKHRDSCTHKPGHFAVFLPSGEKGPYAKDSFR